MCLIILVAILLIIKIFSTWCLGGRRVRGSKPPDIFQNVEQTFNKKNVGLEDILGSENFDSSQNCILF